MVEIVNVAKEVMQAKAEYIHVVYMCSSAKIGDYLAKNGGETCRTSSIFVGNLLTTCFNV